MNVYEVLTTVKFLIPQRKISFIFGMAFTFPTLTDTVIVGLGIHRCMSPAQMFIHELWFKKFPLAVSAFQQDSASMYCLLPLPVSMEKNHFCQKPKNFITEVQDQHNLIPHMIILYHFLRFINLRDFISPTLFSLMQPERSSVCSLSRSPRLAGSSKRNVLWDRSKCSRLERPTTNCAMYCRLSSCEWW